MFRFLATLGRSLPLFFCGTLHPLSVILTACTFFLLLIPAALFSQEPGWDVDFDARRELQNAVKAELGASQRQATSRWREKLPDFEIRYDLNQGTARTVFNRTGYLTPPDPKTPLEIALDLLRDERTLLGLTAADLEEFELTDAVTSLATGAHHLYLRQRHHGIPVYNGQLQIHLNRDGRVLSINNQFVRDLTASIEVIEPRLDAATAVRQATAQSGLWTAREAIETIALEDGPQRNTILLHPHLAPQGSEARLMWLPARRGETRLVWNVALTAPGGSTHDWNIDAVDGRLWSRFRWTRDASYRIFPSPLPSPDHTTPLPPADGRTVIVEPADLNASPLGWHDDGAESWNGLRGNNVHVYEDRNADDMPPAPEMEPSCSANHDCDFPLDLSAPPVDSLDAALTNVFYWVNQVHDVQYRYGFNEAAGNFQTNNFALGGMDADAILAEVQDGGDNCNARFSTPPDGSAPRLQLFTCNNTAPSRDSAFDSTVLVHELGHGISSRQLGGPSNSSCLNNAQQPGEGWSDWFGLVYTAQSGDLGSDSRGIATYFLGQPIDGNGLRPLPYSTDPQINTYTYESISELGTPHGTGSVWAQVLWEVYWTLVESHGFDPDLARADGGAGNQRALLYVNEGLKQTTCSPTFVDARDGVLQAAIDNYGGEDVCALWQTFADFGLGVDAVAGGPDSTNPTNGFAIPTACQCQPNPVASAGEDRSICLGESVVIGNASLQDHSYSWLPSGETMSQITVSPLQTTTYTLTASTTCGDDQDAVVVFVDDGSGGGLADDFESDASGWTATGLWHLAEDSSCANPAYASASRSFYYGQEASCDYDTDAATTGTLTSPVIGGITEDSVLSFDHLRLVENFSGGAFDRTEVEILSDLGTTTVWSRDSTDPSNSQWTNSGPISLSAFAGKPIRVRFRFDSLDGTSNTFPGWFIDNIEISGESPCAPSTGIDWSASEIVLYGSSAPSAGRTQVEDGGETLMLEGDRWYRTVDTFEITPFSVLELEFKSTAEGEIHAIGFDENSQSNDAVRLFQIFGKQRWAGAIQAERRYQKSEMGGYVSLTLPIGKHYSGRRMHLVLVNDHDADPETVSSFFRQVRIVERQSTVQHLDLNSTTFISYAGKDGSGTVEVEDGGLTLKLNGDRWLASQSSYEITSSTVLAFDFHSDTPGELHAIGFEDDDQLLDRRRLFQIAGEQPWSGAVQVEFGYEDGDLGAWRTFAIPVGEFYTGEALRLILVNDEDSTSASGNSRFRNLRLFER